MLIRDRIRPMIIGATFALITLLALPAQASNIVLEWNQTFLEAVKRDRSSDVKTARGAAILHATIFDAVNGIDVSESRFRKGFRAYFVNPHLAPRNASKQASALAAGYWVLVGLYPAQQATFEAQFNQALPTLKGRQSEIQRGLEWGKKVADDILARRAKDGSDGNDPYTPTGIIGTFSAAWNQQYRNVTPFVMSTPAQFRTVPPNPLTSEAYAIDLNEVKDLGNVNSSTRTPEQTEIAFFWEGAAGTVTPPGQWLLITATYAEQEHLNLSNSARLFALMGLGLGDAGILTTDTKAAYSSWRPLAAIRSADQDDNPLTDPDPTWTPLNGGQGGNPEHISGHSTFAGVGSTILARFHGHDEYPFSLTLDTRNGTPVTRSYTSFQQAAQEAGKSRIYLGIHFEKANQDGLKGGRRLGKFLLKTQLLPLHNRSRKGQ